MPAPTSTLWRPGQPDFAPQPGTLTGGDFPQTPILDTFTAGGSPPLDTANWAITWLGTTDAANISGNQWVHGAGAAATAWKQAYGPDCEVYLDVAVLPPTTATHVYLELRRQSPLGTPDGYEARLTPLTGTLLFRKVVSGTTTVLKTSTLWISAGDSVGFRAVGNLLSYYCKRAGQNDWFFVESVVDTTFPNVIGHIGMEANDSTSTTKYDNFGGGSLGPVVVETPFQYGYVGNPLQAALGVRLGPFPQPLVVPPIVAGGATYDKFGTGIIDGFIGSGSDEFDPSELGAGIRGFVGSATDAWLLNRAGSGILGFVGSGGDVFQPSETGAGIRGFSAAGADVCISGETAAGILGHVGAGTDAWAASELGTGILGFSGAATDAVTFSESGTGILGMVGSGAVIRGFISKSGSGIRGFVGFGIDAWLLNRSGTGIRGNVGSGADSWTASERGSGIVVFTASGTKLVFTTFGQVPADVTIVRQDRVDLVMTSGLGAQVDAGSGSKASADVQDSASDAEAEGGTKGSLTIE